jgi:hypothetical protein
MPAALPVPLTRQSGIPLKIFGQRDFEYRLVRQSLASLDFVTDDESPKLPVQYIVKVHTQPVAFTAFLLGSPVLRGASIARGNRSVNTAHRRPPWFS